MGRFPIVAVAAILFATPASATGIDCAPLRNAVASAKADFGSLGAPALTFPGGPAPTCETTRADPATFACEWSWPSAQMGAAQVHSSVLAFCMTTDLQADIADAAADEVAWKLSPALTAVLTVPRERAGKSLVALRFLSQTPKPLTESQRRLQELLGKEGD
jgi:hypothetical protein